MKTLLDEEKIVRTIEGLPDDTFTVLDFIVFFRDLYPGEWKRLVDRFGKFGEKRRYTVSTYLSNRLDVYSQKTDSLLHPLTHYSEGKYRDRRRTTEEERRVFGSPWIAVFRKRG